MSSWRENLTSIPNAVTTFLQEGASTASNYMHHGSTQSLPTTHSSTASTNDERAVSLPIPSSLVKEQWRLIFTSDANAKDLQEAVAHCRELVLMTDECSEERRWLVRHLVDLRYSLKELQDTQTDVNAISVPIVKTVLGHHFVAHHASGNRLQAAAKRYYCDHCTGIIWSVVQLSYICTDCGYLVHQKCIDCVLRVCAHVVSSERQYPIADICPEIGLAAQNYKCAECKVLLNFKNSWIEPRLCDYSGRYFCPSCHWNDSAIIPARVVHNWDFRQHKVSRSALQEIQLFMDKPLIKLEDDNPKLFVFLEKLCAVKKLRQNLVHMRKYLAECKQATDEKLVDAHIGSHRHLIQSNEFYTINDIVQAESGALAELLSRVYTIFERHIRNCDICSAKAYICEICSNNEVIFPFDDGCIKCAKCNSIFHRVCMTRKNMICPKCIRVQERRLQLQQSLSTGSASEYPYENADV